MRKRWHYAASGAVLLTVLAATGCGSRDEPGAIRVSEGKARLASLLKQRGVVPGGRSKKGRRSLAVAWSAFKEFAAIPVRQSELGEGPDNDGLLFEFGVFDLGSRRGALTLSFVRQLSTEDGDLQQVHLDAHFRGAIFQEIKRRLKVVRCASESTCAARCVFDKTTLVGGPCFLAPATRAAANGRALAASTMWSFDTKGSGTDEQRKAWVTLVERSPVFRTLARSPKPLGYEVWQGSAE